VDEAKEVARFDFVARVYAPIAKQPGEETFDMPASTVTTQRTSVLSLVYAPRVMGRDELDAAPPQPPVERIAVVGFVADQLSRERFGETRRDGFLDEERLISRTTRNPCGDRKTSAV
jgi:hypothetical protein